MQNLQNPNPNTKNRTNPPTSPNHLKSNPLKCPNRTHHEPTEDPEFDSARHLW